MDHTTFEHLAALNRSVDAALNTLRKLAEYPELQKRESFMASQSYFREHLADGNVSSWRLFMARKSVPDQENARKVGEGQLMRLKKCLR
jgi:hypothetical protein